jgi:5'-nucleotidase
MLILITNDDGIHSPGLAVLERVARKLSADVVVVAPETDQSGVSHSLSLNDPLRLREVSEGRYAVTGTPTDCVIMAMRHILGDRTPDLLLSGVNRGENAAEDVTYSGTIAAAMEGTLLGVRSMALSQGYSPSAREHIRWDCAEAHGADVIRRALDAGFPPDVLVNINFPSCAPEEVTGAVATVQGRRNAAFLGVDQRKDGRGNPYFWLAIRRSPYETAEGTDLHALAERKISVTPLKLDLTDMPTATEFAQVFGG